MEIEIMLRQFRRFLSVGIVATIVHVLVAGAYIGIGQGNGYLGNTLGFMAAFGISFIGNAHWTFSRSDRLTRQFFRFLVVSVLGLTATTAELAAVRALGWPDWTYLIPVVLTVPPISFLLAKYWAFKLPD